MAVFRVERNSGYTVMSNHHLRNKELTLKAKGLLSQMLSLPEDWDYTLAGLSHINRESIDAIRTAVWELEKAGYILRRQGRDEKGKMTAIEYTIYEQPQPMLENPTSENPTQLNKDRSRTNLSKKEKSITDLSSTDSFPILSPDPSPCRAAPERKGTEAFKQSAVDIYREIIMENIEYDTLTQDPKMDKERLDEIVDLMLETVCSARKTLRIAGDDYPAELVKSKFLKLNSSHIEFVMDDPQAAAKLEAKLVKLESAQETMKAVNAYFRKNKTLEGCPSLTPEQITKLQQKCRSPGIWIRAGRTPPICSPTTTLRSAASVGALNRCGSMRKPILLDGNLKAGAWTPTKQITVCKCSLTASRMKQRGTS